MTVHLNGEDNVVQMGDDLVGYGFPFIDMASGGKRAGDGRGDGESVHGIAGRCEGNSGARRHFEAGRRAGLRVKMLKETSAAVQKAIDEHKTIEQMKQEKILEPWRQWSGEIIDSDKFIETLYNSLTRTKGEFVEHN